MTGKPSLMAPAPQATVISLTGLYALTNALMRSKVYLWKPSTSPGWMAPKDHRRAHDQGDDVTDGPDLLADRNDTDGEAHGKTGLDSLLDDAANQEHEDTAGLIALDGLNPLPRWTEPARS